MPEIVQWLDIEDDFEHGLLLGNGASVAVHEGFSYTSLYSAATNRGYITPPVKKIFDSFETEDFEFVLRMLWQAKLVNDALEIKGDGVDQAYQEVRSALIATIRAVHINYEDCIWDLEHIYPFMQRFDTVISLNYDLIVYWAAMLGNGSLGLWFKDCFNKGVFREDWSEVREPFGRAKGATLFFYPHGSLVLARRKLDTERKMAAGDNTNLLEAIFNNWKSGNNVPIFVCEGNSERKKNAISQTGYLQRVYREVFPEIGESLVVYGWSFSDQDKHILSRLRPSISKIKRVAVSIYNNDQNFAQKIEDKLTGIGIKDVFFFDAASTGCWNNPKG